MDTPYVNTKDLTIRFRCSSRTIFRKMKRRYNPLPAPVIVTPGSSNLWLLETVIEWELREMQRTHRLNTPNESAAH